MQQHKKSNLVTQLLRHSILNLIKMRYDQEGWRNRFRSQHISRQVQNRLDSLRARVNRINTLIGWLQNNARNRRIHIQGRYRFLARIQQLQREKAALVASALSYRRNMRRQ